MTYMANTYITTHMMSGISTYTYVACTQ